MFKAGDTVKSNQPNLLQDLRFVILEIESDTQTASIQVAKGYGTFIKEKGRIVEQLPVYDPIPLSVLAPARIDLDWKTECISRFSRNLKILFLKII
ncbi:hypothetical protein Q9L42_020360 (plasmid) [Methylomarinum sp. Ch1-1]|uniref:Uncharacterized protein n=1 Tax=Methylomarinum roseum TaxID=3067653 RepID=A0AAU7P086_9GAMM|nr:hypothetical protein [Methylomarinum sp. Ch1-1]MDP4523265.1 hypothetical protein [Methylomarinum sp. Ch1-1]